MSYKPFVIFVIILLFLSTCIYSTSNDTFFEEQDSHFFCKDVRSIYCCPSLAHKVATDYHSRHASIILTNKSGYNMTVNIISIIDGRWVTRDDYDDENSADINCEPRNLLDNESESISSVTSHFFGGLKGYVSFTMDDDIKSEFFISWEVPTIGPADFDFDFLGSSSLNKYYSVIDDIVFGKKIYQITINKKEPWSMMWMLLMFPFIGVCMAGCVGSIANEQNRSYKPLGREEQRPQEQRRLFEQKGQYSSYS